MDEENGKKTYDLLRVPKFAALERLVCSYLIESLNASPLESVTYVCRAAQLLGEDDLKRLNLDIEAINSVYTVAQRLFASKIDIPNDSRSPRHHVLLGTLDFETDILPWIKAKHYPHYITYNQEDFDLETMSHKEAFDLTNHDLSVPGYQMLVSDFLQMATPFTQTLGGILTQLISPQTYSDMLMVYKGGRKNDPDG